jgi:glyoxylase-like metal-dependent hydrolase (beta-lactamase superfamily II)
MPPRRKRLLAALAAGALIAGCAALCTGRMDCGVPFGGERFAVANGAVHCAVDDYVSACLLETGGEQVVLIDAGLDPEAGPIRALLQERGYGPGDVAAIFLTHGHGDHIGGVGAFPGAKVYVLEADVDLVEGRRVADNAVGWFQSAAPTGVTVARGLVDGEVVRVGALRVEVFAIPGHTRGSAALLARGVLFVGDSAAASSDGTMRAGPPIFSADRPQNRASLTALAARLGPRAGEVRAMAFSHQGPLPGLAPLLDWAAAQD